MRIFRKRGKKMRDPAIEEAQREALASSEQAEKDLAFQQAQAHDEHNNVILPLRRTIGFNHIGEMIVRSLAK